MKLLKILKNITYQHLSIVFILLLFIFLVALYQNFSPDKKNQNNFLIAQNNLNNNASTTQDNNNFYNEIPSKIKDNNTSTNDTNEATSSNSKGGSNNIIYPAKHYPIRNTNNTNRKYHSRKTKKLNLQKKQKQAKLKKTYWKNIQKQALYLEKQLYKTPTDLSLRIQTAQKYQLLQNDKKVIKLLYGFVNELPKTALLLLAKAYTNTKNYLNAIRILNVIITKNPKDVVATTLLGKAYADDNKYTEAIEQFRKAIQIDPSYLIAYEELVDTFKIISSENSENNYEYRMLLHDMTNIFGVKARYLNDLCRLYSEENFLNETITYCQEAINKNPFYPDNHIHLGLALLDLNQITKGKSIIRSAAKKFTKSTFVQLNAGYVFFMEKDYILAQKYFITCLKNDPKHTDCLIGLAESYFNNNKFNKALPVYYKVCNLDMSTLTKFKSSAAKLRHFNRPQLHKQYNYYIEKCKYTPVPGF